MAESQHVGAIEHVTVQDRGSGQTGLVKHARDRRRHTDMAFTERRLKPHGLHVARVEEWILKIENGERFELPVPKGVKPAVGDTVELEAVLRDGPLRSKWSKLSTF